MVNRGSRAAALGAHSAPMTPAIASALMPLMRGFDPETAHGLALRALSLGLAGRDPTPDDPIMATRAFGLDFRNPLGLAAGFDKEAEAILPLMRLGFGHVEAGSVTPRAQPGNPRPRLFRLVEDRAVINRMGMNGTGLEAFCARLAALRRPLPAVVGANLGINKEGSDPECDYPAMTRALTGLADYVVVNVSSPNTPGLRDLQGEARLIGILDAMAASGPAMPVLVKLAPDLSESALPALVEACIARGVAGLILTNTTIARPESLRSAHAPEAGGLSGPPLFAASTAMLAQVFRLAAGRLTLIGCGGVGSAEQAYAKIRAGATLVQFYAALAYDGPALVPRMKTGLSALLRRDGFASVADAVGVDA